MSNMTGSDQLGAATLARVDPGSDSHCRFVRHPVEMAAALSAGSESGARSFAIAMHERACFEDDEDKREFWHLVLRHLDLSHAEAPPRDRQDAPVRGIVDRPVDELAGVGA